MRAMSKNWFEYTKIEDMSEDEYREHVKRLREKKEIRELDKIAAKVQKLHKSTPPKVILRRSSALQ